jgi:hypothetical protein
MEERQHRWINHAWLRDSSIHRTGRWSKKTLSTGRRAWLGSMKTTKTFLKASWVWTRAITLSQSLWWDPGVYNSMIIWIWMLNNQFTDTPLGLPWTPIITEQERPQIVLVRHSLRMRFPSLFIQSRKSTCQLGSTIMRGLLRVKGNGKKEHSSILTQ